MRPTRALLCLALVSGCAAGTDGALTAEDAKSKLAVKDGALSRLAQTQLTVIRTAATAWAAEHGGVMTGFADDLRATQPSVASTAAELTDTSVTVAVGTGQCLVEQLPAGSPVPTAC
ncbi:MAG TPA: hypothetical protein VMZ11_05730 [Mycobacteriales bacterium]|nr:hypothetical protein [Mycobacteriales bacterium]